MEAGRQKSKVKEVAFCIEFMAKNFGNVIILPFVEQVQRIGLFYSSEIIL